MVGIRGETTRMSGWTRPQLFWTVLFCGHRLCGGHVAYDRIHGAWRIRGPLPYTCIRMVSYRAMRCGYFMSSQVLES
jgi:hypothetical protein